MNEQDFKRMYFCNFEPSEKDRLLYALAEQYENMCESYDRSVCSGKSKYDGCAMPANRVQLELINRKAQKVKRMILDANPSVTSKELMNAIKKYNERR